MSASRPARSASGLARLRLGSHLGFARTPARFGSEPTGRNAMRRAVMSRNSFVVCNEPLETRLRISGKKKAARSGLLSGRNVFCSSHERAVITPPALKVGSRARRQCLARSPKTPREISRHWCTSRLLSRMAALCLPRRPAARDLVANVSSAHATAQQHPTARRLPVKAKHSVWRFAPLAFRSAPALTWPPAWAVTGCVSRADLSSLSRMKRKRSRTQTEVAFVPPGHSSGGRLVLDLPPRPLARSLRTLPDRRTPSRSRLASLPVTGPRAVRVTGPRTERSWSRRLGGRTGHAARSGVRLLGGEKAFTLVHFPTTPHSIEQAYPLVG